MFVDKTFQYFASDWESMEETSGYHCSILCRFPLLLCVALFTSARNIHDSLFSDAKQKVTLWTFFPWNCSEMRIYTWGFPTWSGRNPHISVITHRSPQASLPVHVVESSTATSCNIYSWHLTLLQLMFHVSCDFSLCIFPALDTNHILNIPRSGSALTFWSSNAERSFM